MFGYFYLTNKMDTVSKEKRSEIMSKVHSRDTKPEVYVRHLLWHSGFRYRKNCGHIAGTPDIYLAKYNSALFVHGCFWHRHQGCSHTTIPKSNTEFWIAKFERNVERDKRNREKLVNSGTKVIIVWECTVKKMMKDDDEQNKILNDIISALKSEEIDIYEF